MSLQRWSLFIFLLFCVNLVQAQITAPTSSSSQPTAYTDGSSQDEIYFFCSESGNPAGSLYVESTEEVTFEWSRYESSSASFQPFSTETGTSSQLNNLEDGAYKVQYTHAGGTTEDIVWVFSVDFDFTIALEETTCDYNKFTCDVHSNDSFTYYNVQAGSPIQLNREFTFEWFEGSDRVSRAQNPSVYEPPTSDVDYTCTVSDISGCEASESVFYQSIVPGAEFSWSHQQTSNGSVIQAPLEVQFENSSENADEYFWKIYKSREDLYEEGLASVFVDSLLTTFTEENPIYTYEASGTYDVKLIVSKMSENLTCMDSVFLADPIEIDTSLVSVAPVLTPNGDGINDELVIKTVSLESLDFQVFNRWGKRIHSFQKTDFMPEDAELAAWDGKIGGKIASEGVYFYVVEAKGRDGKSRRTKGFVHLFD